MISRNDKWEVRKEKDESVGWGGTRGFVITLNEEEEAIKKKKKKADGSRGWKRVGLLFCYGQRSSSYNCTTRVPVSRNVENNPRGLVLEAWTTKP